MGKNVRIKALITIISNTIILLVMLIYFVDKKVDDR